MQRRQGWKLLSAPSPSCCRLTPGHSSRSPGKTAHMTIKAKVRLLTLLRPKEQQVCRCMLCVKPYMYLCVCLLLDPCLSSFECVWRTKGLSRFSVCLCAQYADSRPLSLLSQPDQSNCQPTLPDLALTPVM